MRYLTDDEVLAAIDRGMRRVWERFPASPDASREAKQDSAMERLAEAHRQSAAVAASADAEADQAFIDAVSDWGDG
jgi:hypothetical protein